MKSLFVFRRDLRLHDNTALMNALRKSDEVLPVFILDKRQLESPYRSDNLVQFMSDSLVDLDEQLAKKGAQLHICVGIAEEVIQKTIQKKKIGAVYINKDYTPFSIKRDEKIEFLCQKESIEFFSSHDSLLTPPGSVLTNDGSPYQVFSSFLKKARLKKIKEPQKNNHKNYATYRLDNQITLSVMQKLLVKKRNEHTLAGGRSEGLKKLKLISTFKNYAQERNYPALQKTTGLSAHNKFGTISIREFYHTVKEKLDVEHILINELFWRDFFTHIVFHYPYVLGTCFRKKYEHLKWENNHNKFQVWCDGKTGFPIVDAGMRELNKTGFMHNRVRMIVASFLVKDLHIDWRWGEKYFAQQLVDYDPAVNNGNWQWASSTGCDAQPYFRIFNPFLQQKRFDPDCVYIKHWIPELKNVDNKEIHQWSGNDSYPAPIVDHAIESKRAKEMYKRL